MYKLALESVHHGLLRANRLTLNNKGKTEYMIIGSTQRLAKIYKGTRIKIW